MSDWRRTQNYLKYNAKICTRAWRPIARILASFDFEAAAVLLRLARFTWPFTPRERPPSPKELLDLARELLDAVSDERHEPAVHCGGLRAVRHRKGSLDLQVTLTDMTTPILWPDASRPVNLSSHQREQLARATVGRLGLLIGTPGTGKTYTTGALVDVLAEDYGMSSIAVCAPTGKAAVRVTEAMNRAGVPIRATTIHTLLEITRNGHDGDGWLFARNKDNPLTQRFVIVDEASMVDTDLAASLFSAIGAQTHLLFVGDPYQLPPVGHGAPLRDLIAANVPRGELTEIQRNAGLIIRACASIKQGEPFETCRKYDDDAGLNLRHIETEKPDEQLEALLALFAKLQQQSAHNWHPLWDLQVILATNDSGPLSRKEVNRLLQAHLNPTGCGHPDHPFKVGDKVICLRNHFALDLNDPNGPPHYLANGEIGEVLDVAPVNRFAARFTKPERFILAPIGKTKKDDDNGEPADSGLRTGCDFDFAYGITCHKSQGSEWPVVVVLIDSGGGARRICTREWLYTAISRASTLCITIGRLGVAQQMGKRPALDKRKTLLAELIRGEG